MSLTAPAGAIDAAAVAARLVAARNLIVELLAVEPQTQAQLRIKLRRQGQKRDVRLSSVNVMLQAMIKENLVVECSQSGELTLSSKVKRGR